MTCEEYVVDKLRSANKEVERLNIEVSNLKSALAEAKLNLDFATDGLKLIGSYLEVDKSRMDNDLLIRMNMCVYKSYDPEDFRRIVNLLHLELPIEEEIDEENTDESGN